MSGRQGFITNHETYVYQEAPGSKSAAFGLDSQDSYKWKLKVQQTDGAIPTGTCHFTVDSQANGNITLTPNGIGRVVCETGATITAGGLTVTAGNTTITPLAGGADTGVVLHNNAGVLSSSDHGTAGQVLLSGGAGFAPAWGNNGGVTWTEATGATLALVANNAYIMNRATLITATLPLTAAKGSIIRFTGVGAGGYKIEQRVTQIIYFGTLSTTPGIGGSLASTFDRDSIELVCVVADTDWNVISSLGNWTVV